MARVSPTMRRAQSSTRSPSGVKPWKREPRLTSSTPKLSSSCFTPADKRRLGHAAGLGGAAEMLFAGQREEEFELVDHRITRLYECDALRDDADRDIQARHMPIRRNRNIQATTVVLIDNFYQSIGQ